MFSDLLFWATGIICVWTFLRVIGGERERQMPNIVAAPAPASPADAAPKAPPPPAPVASKAPVALSPQKSAS
jgi:hypothetical protein